MTTEQMRFWAEDEVMEARKEDKIVYFWLGFATALAAAAIGFIAFAVTVSL